jgi:alpha-beta hydrolase superfamily lysophospholipase
MKEIPISFKSENQRIDGILHLPNKKNPSAIIIVHGYGGYAFTERFADLARKFCKKGFAVLRFQFRYYKNFKNFVKLTISSEIKDLRSAIDFIEKQEIDKKNIFLVTESLGGIIAILLNDARVKAMALWSPNIYLKNVFRQIFGKKVIENLEKKGFSEYVKHTTGEKIIIGKAFWDEIKRISYLDEKIIKKVKCPILIVNGTKDWAYKGLESAKKLYKFANEPKKIKIIKNGEHTFDSEKYSKIASEWFKRWLK